MLFRKEVIWHFFHLSAVEKILLCYKRHLAVSLESMAAPPFTQEKTAKTERMKLLPKWQEAGARLLGVLVHPPGPAWPPAALPSLLLPRRPLPR